jgi:hypothetical protein
MGGGEGRRQETEDRRKEKNPGVQESQNVTEERTSHPMR